MNNYEHPVWPHLTDAWQDSIARGLSTFEEVWESFPELRRFFPTQKEVNDAIPWPFKDLNQITAFDLPPMEPIIGPFQTSTVNIVAATRGTGKTMMMTDIADCVASGRAFCDWAVDKPGPVAFVQLDMGVHQVQKRARRREWHQDFHYITRYQFQRADMPVPDLGDPEQHDRIVNALKDYRMVIFDTRRACQPPGSGAAGNLWHPSYWLASAPVRYRLIDAGVCVVLLDHLTNSGEVKDTKAIEDDADAVIALKHSDKGSAPLCVQVEMSKDRDNVGIFTYLEFDGDGWRMFTDVSLKREVYNYRNGYEGHAKHTIRETADEYDISEATVKNWCNEIRAEIRATHG